jgi:hypothetical protein
MTKPATKYPTAAGSLIRATKPTAQTDARMTTSVLINRASAIHSSDAGHDDYIACIVTALTGINFLASLTPPISTVEGRG